MSTTEQVRALIAPVLDAEGIEVLDVEFAGGTLRITLDRPEGVDLEVVATASEHISAVLDEHDPVSDRYTLEVSSPGVERLLRTPEHFKRFVGSKVALKTFEERDGTRRFEGELSAADSDGIVVDGISFTYNEIERARTVFEWNANPKKTNSGRATQGKK